jgi:hypothetical protein
MKQLQFIDIPNSSTCFGQFFAHPQERKTMFYSMWYNATKLLPAGGLERGRHLLQGGSNMTGTAAACLHTNQSRSYLNRPVCVRCEGCWWTVVAQHHMLQNTVLRSWGWATNCPKHVELIGISINCYLLHLVALLHYAYPSIDARHISSSLCRRKTKWL